MNVYQLRAESCYGKEEEAKRAKQLELLKTFDAVEGSNGHVYCSAALAMALIQAGYCGTSYIDLHQIKEVKINHTEDTLENIRRSSAPEGYSEAFNHKCGAEQPTPWLNQVVRTMLLSDACTDQLQSKIAEGWRIVAVQPQPDQRRPDYILGRNDPELPTEAERP